MGAGDIGAIDALRPRSAHQNVEPLVGGKVSGTNSHRLVRHNADDGEGRDRAAGRGCWVATRGNTEPLAHINAIWIIQVIGLSNHSPVEAIPQSDAIQVVIPLHNVLEPAAGWGLVGRIGRGDTERLPDKDAIRIAQIVGLGNGSP